MKIPFLFIRHQRCTEENGLVPNCFVGSATEKRVSFIVKRAMHTDETLYNAKWMDDPTMGACGTCYTSDDFVTVPGIDITEETFVFDNDDLDEARYQALRKVRELWIQVEVG